MGKFKCLKSFWSFQKFSAVGTFLGSTSQSSHVHFFNAFGSIAIVRDGVVYIGKAVFHIFLLKTENKTHLFCFQSELPAMVNKVCRFFPNSINCLASTVWIS